ncbi:glycosyltransferase family 39 protein [Candidatus Woesearchaeota archaeon]|nr:glycosyltransferase family 39 protein [Candidatus Woesearchaeota archaeon]
MKKHKKKPKQKSSEQTPVQKNHDQEERKKAETEIPSKQQTNTPNTSTRTSLDIIKKYYPWAILAIIVIIGATWRFYHVDYPVLGYHNWKETHYLTEARNFAEDGFFNHGFFIPVFDYPVIDRDPSGAHTDSFPLTSIITGFMFKIFGPSLAIARTISILFNLLAVIGAYLIIKELTRKEGFALLTAGLFALNPLFIFFGRQVQLINPSLGLMMIGFFFYLRWLKNEKPSYMITAATLIMFSVVSKYSFAIAVVPILLTLPYRKMMKAKWWLQKKKELIISVVIAMFIPFWLWYSQYALKEYGVDIVTASINSGGSMVFTKAWWANLGPYIADNYTTFGWKAALGGMLVFLGVTIYNFYKTRKISMFARFILGYGIASIIFLFIAADKMRGHSYHQYPIAPFVIFMIAYIIYFISLHIGNFIGSLVKENALKKINVRTIQTIFVIVVMLWLVFLFPTKNNSIYSKSMEAKDRQFNTQFIGLDAIGEYINMNSLPDERIIHSSGQDYGLIWHADRKALSGAIPNYENMTYVEDELNVKWVVFYQWGLQFFQNPDVADTVQYIMDNYQLAQVGVQQTQQGVAPVYIILKKGGNFSLETMNDLLQNKPVKTWTYESTTGSMEMATITVI